MEIEIYANPSQTILNCVEECCYFINIEGKVFGKRADRGFLWREKLPSF